jgi:hypothetical protein
MAVYSKILQIKGTGLTSRAMFVHKTGKKFFFLKSLNNKYLCNTVQNQKFYCKKLLPVSDETSIFIM